MRLGLFASILVFVSGAFSHAASARMFSCEQKHDGADLYLLVYETGGALKARFDDGTGVTSATPLYFEMSKAEARRNYFVSELAGKVLKVNWAKVAKVEAFEIVVGSFRAGAIGINFLDAKGKVYAKGMWMGQSGPMACKRIVRAPRK